MSEYTKVDSKTSPLQTSSLEGIITYLIIK